MNPEQTTWTPGPWEVCGHDKFGMTMVCQAPVSGVCDDLSIYVYGGSHNGSSAQESNARLVACAPELAECLAGILEIAEDAATSDNWPTIKRARALLAKISSPETP